MKTRSFVLAFLLAAVVLPGAARAQSQSAGLQPGSPEALAKSDALVQKVQLRLESSEWAPGALRDMSDKLEKAASLRSDDDPRALVILQSAGALAYAGKDRLHARGIYERLARRALENGDVVLAANALTQAAWIALEQKDHEAVIRFSERALRLSNSPLLTSAQRDDIRRRFDGRPAMAQRVR